MHAFKTRIKKGLTSPLVFILALLFCITASPVQADNNDPIGDFFSMLRPPEIKLPQINIVPFWTDDLKRARGAYMDGDYDQAAEYFRKSSNVHRRSTESASFGSLPDQVFPIPRSRAFRLCPQNSPRSWAAAQQKAIKTANVCSYSLNSFRSVL